MDRYIYYRVFGSVVSLSLIPVLTLSCAMAMWKELPTHPELQIFYNLGFRYNTVWNLIFLCIYACISLMCDISTIRKRENDVYSYLRDFRFKIFHEIVFPQVANMVVFWPIYFYDRELVFPTKADILVSPFGNFVFHGFAVIYVFWELIFLPQHIPKRSDVKNTYFLGICVFYCVVVIYTRYVDLGVWMYEVLTATEGTILFPVVFFSLFIVSYISFYGQWHVKVFVWKLRKTRKVE